MAYNFRNRNLLDTRDTYNGSSSDSDSHDSDSDFRICRPPRRSNQNNNITPPEGGASSSRVMGRKQRRRRKRRTFSRVREVQETKRTMLSWLINMGIMKEEEVVRYIDPHSGHKLKEGKLNKLGIACSCCFRQFKATEFEAHAGCKTSKPYKNIVLAKSQLPLFQCQIEAWKHKDEEERRKFNNIQPAPKAVDKSDDACLICADGGDLICCESCPSTFHAKCIFMETMPQGDWLCSYCVCKYCGRGDGPLNRCMQCEKQYHCKCGGEKVDLMNSPAALFCGNSCRKIYEGLQRLLGVRNDLGDGRSWTLLQRTDQPMACSNEDDVYNKIQCNSKIAVAWLVMNECFMSAIDRHTRVNIVQSIVYNRGFNFPRINYSGFYTVVLEKNDEMISVASIRVHGKRLAEMPYIGTRAEHRCRGMAQDLEKCVESALSALEVKKLVIPSMNQLTSMWINKYKYG